MLRYQFGDVTYLPGYIMQPALYCFVVCDPFWTLIVVCCLYPERNKAFVSEQYGFIVSLGEAGRADVTDIISFVVAYGRHIPDSKHFSDRE